ncbi:hypothetical protein E4U61_006675 [Claviceps capensis]|nr:hypothetical protein E4U61_006675 [Claviceps capensis]
MVIITGDIPVVGRGFVRNLDCPTFRRLHRESAHHETLLDMPASLRIPGSTLLLKSMGSEEVLPKFRDFQQMLEERHGAGREVTLVDTITGPKAISILYPRNQRPAKYKVVNEIIKDILDYDQDPPTQELLKELLSDLLDRGMNLTIPAPGLPSPLFRVLYRREAIAKPDWLFDLLCEKGATIHEDEVSIAFLRWCETPRLWRTNKYDAWWQREGQEDEIFQKWCEHPYNVWWWQHFNQISPVAATMAHAQVQKVQELVVQRLQAARYVHDRGPYENTKQLRHKDVFASGFKSRKAECSQ